MKLVSQEVGTLGTTVPIVDGKERTSWPEVDLLELGLDNVEDDRHSVLVIIPHHSLMGIGCISDNDAIFLRRELSWVVILSEFHYLLLLHLHVFFPLTDSHFHATVFDDVIRT